MSGTAPGRAACEAEDRDRWDEVYPCGALSRFVVERDDHDPAYSPAESCENHLAEIVAAMADGHEVRLIVTIRWDKPDAGAEDEPSAITPAGTEHIGPPS